MPDLGSKSALMIIASDQFRDEEYQEPRKALEGAGVKVTVASSKPGTARGMLGARAESDLLIGDVITGDYDAVIFVGGSGSSEYFNDPTAHKIARDAARDGKLLCAICIAPSTLANAGVLKGKRVTSWTSETGNLADKGAIVTGNPVEVDGKIITADGPKSAARFARKIIEALATE